MHGKLNLEQNLVKVKKEIFTLVMLPSAHIIYLHLEMHKYIFF